MSGDGSAEAYWRMKADETAKEHITVIHLQRDEIQRLQLSCSELMFEKSMARAAAAEELRQFCLDYQQRQQQQPAPGPSQRAADTIPVREVLRFLHDYTSGMVHLPPEVNPRKRARETVTGGRPQKDANQRRLVQRVMARQRLRLRDDDVGEFMQQLQQQQQQGQEQQPVHDQRRCADGTR